MSGPDETQMHLLRDECDIYRNAIVRLVCDATSGDRKTMDKSTVAAIAGQALERGNDVHRRSKALAR